MVKDEGKNNKKQTNKKSNYLSKQKRLIRMKGIN